MDYIDYNSPTENKEIQFILYNNNMNNMNQDFQDDYINFNDV